MNTLTYMFIGAHPDDADIDCGGTALLLKQSGHTVVFVSLTDGSAGHQDMGREELAARRKEEAQKVSQRLGIKYEIMDNFDGDLVASLENRRKLIRLIRSHKPDVIISPRPNDYHPDHRATGQLVQDCSFLLTVPMICPDIPPLKQNPYIFYHHDKFSKPTPFTPEILVDITSIIDQKMQNVALHESQIFEWMPFIEHFDDQTPSPQAGYLDWMKRHFGNYGGVERFLSLLNKPEAKYLEAFERCEYGSPVTVEVAKQLFPFAVINFQ